MQLGIFSRCVLNSRDRTHTQSYVPGRLTKIMGQDAAVPLVSFQEYFSNWATLASQSSTGEGGGSEPDQIKTGLSGKDPSQTGLTTHLCQSLHPGPCH